MQTKEQQIEEIFERGTIMDVLPNVDDFKKRLASPEKMRFYIGFDATAPTLHLSHAKNIMLLEKFRKLGHEVIVLFGDFTARIGDPTGESTSRTQLSREDVVRNVEIWKGLITPLMDFDAVENPPIIKYNNDWLAKLSMEDILQLSSNFTVQQMLERDMFEKRINAKKPVYLHEFLYPLMQGYDSVVMDVDVELCGTDQIFNALAGRTLQKRINKKEKFVVSVTLMEDPKTGDLMSKSKGTGIFLDTEPNDKFGQVMAQTDEMIDILLRHCTSLSLEEIDSSIAKGPRDAKMHLAYEIVKIFHGEDSAQDAQTYFIETFSNKKAPTDAVNLPVAEGELLINVLARASLATSKGDARRKMVQGGVSINDEKIIDATYTITSDDAKKILRVGKKEFRKIILTK